MDKEYKITSKNLMADDVVYDIMKHLCEMQHLEGVEVIKYHHIDDNRTMILYKIKTVNLDMNNQMFMLYDIHDRGCAVFSMDNYPENVDLMGVLDDLVIKAYSSDMDKLI